MKGLTINEKLEFRRIIKKLKNEEDIKSAILFGSAVNNKQFNDLDVLLILTEETPENLFNLINVMKTISQKSKKFKLDLVFAKEGSSSKKIISCVPISKFERDHILEYSISINHKNLFGENPFENMKRPKKDFFIRIIKRKRRATENDFKVLKRYIFTALLWKGFVPSKNSQLKLFHREYKTNLFGKSKTLEVFYKENKNKISLLLPKIKRIILKEIGDKNKSTNNHFPWEKRELFVFNTKLKINEFIKANKPKQLKKYIQERQQDYNKNFKPQK